MKLEQTMEPVLKTQMELEAHEKECAIRYANVQEKLESLDKRMWRLEAMIMGSTILVVAMVVSVFMGFR
jgi:chromosome segregation ATPase|tara:strand:- start:1077 stop:1283 length:207 start_codon:yes stop_codon:yes gene_type:complete